MSVFIVVLMSCNQVVQADYYPNTSQQGTNGSPIYYPASVTGTNRNASVVPVNMARTGAHVVLGGTVISLREVTLTAQIPGRIEYIAGTEGDWFKEGELLVAVDDDDMLAKRRQAIAQLYGTASSLRNARAQYTREFWAPQALEKYDQFQTAPSMGFFPSMFERFMGGGQNNRRSGYQTNPWVIRDVDLHSQGTHVSQAQSQLYGARSRIEEIDAHLRDALSTTPFDGVIVKKLAEEGDTVQPGQALLKFADTRYLQLKVDVPARLVSALNKGMVVPAKMDVGNVYIEVRVAQIYPTADSQRHTVTVKFDLPSGVAGGPGMYAEVMIPDTNTPIKDLPVIPGSSVVWRGSLPAVFVLNQNGKAELRLIRLGDQVDGNNVAVLSGIQPGEQVFAYPPAGIKSGWSPSKKSQP
ncbi:MAG: efflux RND transporter periplasmic adaptor subunit [Gammaproteobacteria bacterium]|nr:efflux RND transporter periplasmic adaptor subunit [Gammaproteobacteria bacterium]